jgi:hypothetical protein
VVGRAESGSGLLLFDATKSRTAGSWRYHCVSMAQARRRGELGDSISKALEATIHALFFSYWSDDRSRGSQAQTDQDTRR